MDSHGEKKRETRGIDRTPAGDLVPAFLHVDVEITLAW